MRFLGISLFSFFSVAALGASHPDTCLVTSVDEAVSPWEEGLVVYGEGDEDSSDVTFNWKRGKLDYVSVGQKTFRTSNEDLKIEVKKSAKETSYTISRGEEHDQIKVIVYASEKGVVLFKDEGESKYATMATFDCTQLPLKAEVGDKNVTELTSAGFRKLSKEVQERLSVDVPVELGDGYYSTLESKYYAIKAPKRDGEVVGYLLWERLSYTEDPEEVIALVRFNARGYRLGEIEESRIPLE